MSFNCQLGAVEYSLDEMTGTTLYASMEVGSNGDSSGDPTYAMGDDQGEEGWGYYTWDSDTSGGFDSGSVPVAFSGDTSGNETINVGDSGDQTHAGDPFGSISSVMLQAGVQIPASAAWTNISIQFFNGNQLLETDSVHSGPAVSTINTPSTPVAEQTLTVFPMTQNANKVVVTGTMRMTSPTSTPGSADMFCNIFINA